MGNIRFTKEQQRVIDTHNRNILVSAAAGSGKTAVLVERIIRMLLDETKTTTIENILVVTFTNAAAAEMRERIGEALYKAIEADPYNDKIRAQLTLLPTATIMTLHAFCLQVIKSHFYGIDLDPSFSIGDDAELTLVRREILEAVIEAFYEEGSPEFIDMMDAYAPGKTDAAIEPLLLELYQLSMSHPYPVQWLEDSVSKLDIPNQTIWFESIYVTYAQKEINATVQGLKTELSNAFALIGDEPGLQPYKVTLGQYEVILEKLNDAKTTEELFGTIGAYELQRAKAAKRGTDETLVAPAKASLNLIKEGLKKIKADYSILAEADWLERLALSHGHMKTLAQVVKAFMAAYTKEKRRRNVIDFNDIEHFALQILEDDAICETYRQRFNEIMVDEYQDSNLVQETLITRVSRIIKETPNVFMVGDMKQSIYKFRLAKPELFAKKYDTYTHEASDYQKIELQKNFRSRKEVIDTTNYLFKQVMSKTIGDVVYDETAALNQGAKYAIDSEAYTTEFCMIDGQACVGKNPREIEAHHVAKKVQALVHRDEPMMIYDKRLGEERPVDYGDVAILLRTMSGWSETFVEVFRQYNIPIKSMLTTGYFDAIEIQVMLNALSIIDNPKQDIPLLSVLRSPMFEFTADELMTIRMVSKETDYHTALMSYHDSIIGHSNLDNKVIHFVAVLAQWRELSKMVSIHELVNQILLDTSYYDYCSLMVGGLQRSANLDMFIEQVYVYEQSSYKGLFDFIRYMAMVKKQSIDYGIAAIEAMGSGQVTLMSIHKSKGLEFPVVVVAGLGKQFNRMDMNKSILLHQDFGFGTDMIDVARKVKYPSPIKQIVRNQMGVEMLSEELRILYVALTRAREKLVLFGFVKNIEKQIEKVKHVLSMKTIGVDTWLVKEAKSFMDVLLMGFMRNSAMKQLVHDYGVEWNTYVPLQTEEPTILFECISEQETFEKALLLSDEETFDIDTSLYEKLEAAFQWSYPYEAVMGKHVSQSVSELKKKEEASTDMVYSGPVIERPIYEPTFIQEEVALSGAAKGTVYHKAMEKINLELVETMEDVEKQVTLMVENGVITSKEAATINRHAILKFVHSSIGKRALAAKSKDLLMKETPFIMGIYEETLNDYQMIQGVIDMYFEEEDGLVMIDYKTDFVKESDMGVLTERYKTQMKLYKQALEMQSGKKVKEIYLYSVGLQRAIKVDMINL